MDRFFQAVFKVLFAAIVILLLLQAVASAVGEGGFLILLAVASILAYAYRENGKPRDHRRTQSGPLERERVGGGDDGGGEGDADGGGAPWTR
jgi:hypothetical protein